jgi:hypothetical protein
MGPFEIGSEGFWVGVIVFAVIGVASSVYALGRFVGWVAMHLHWVS